MTDIYGEFIKTNKNSSDSFTIISNGAFVICKGISLSLYKYTPLKITGEIEQNKNSIVCSTLDIDFGNKIAIVKLLSGRAFSGVGKVMAERIYNRLSLIANGSFYNLSEQNISDCAVNAGVDKKVADKIASTLTTIRIRLQIFSYIKRYGGTLQDAENLYIYFNGAACDKITENPYVGLECGTSFSVCDNIFYDNHSDNGIADERLNAICYTLSNYIKKSGSCCFRIKDLIKYAEIIQKKSKYESLPDVLIEEAILSYSDFIILDTKKYGTVVYPKNLYEAEKLIVKEIIRLINSSKAIPTQDIQTAGLDEDQEKAIGFLKNSGVYILTGGPGVGKTTTIKSLISTYSICNPDSPIFLCAPTGRAAGRITEATGERASTIHKLLDVRTDNQGGFTYGYNNIKKLPQGMCIVDEMSMVDELLFLRLLQALPDGTLLILSGDPWQLPSVSAGTVLKDLAESGEIPMVTLTHMHRQAEGSTIIDNYYKIRNKDINLISDDHFYIGNYSATDIPEIITKLFDYFNDPQNPDNFQILSLTNKGFAGKDNLNNIISEHISQSRTSSYKNTGYCVGDKVMMIVNNYSKYYWNGDTGIITKILPDGVSVKFKDKEKDISEAEFSGMTHAWACTVHKSQGSEYNTVVIVITDEYKNVLYNSIFLTAETRAKTNIVILNINHSMDVAITTDREDSRITGLGEMLVNTLSKR